jgi:predicted ester cyclase/quinol monooxygenase YgiN
MYVRVNMLSGDPAQLSEAVRYLDGTVRSDVESQPGSRGLALWTNASLGLCVIASYWDSVDAMTASEQAVQVARKEITGLMKGTVTVEQYEVPVFVRRSRPSAGAGTRIVRIECSPPGVDAVIDEFRNTGVPGLMEMTGLCSGQLLVDRITGRCMIVSTWEDADAMAASRAEGSRRRASLTDVTHSQVRSVEEYRLEFSSVREGDTRSLIERDIELWNARDREGWIALGDLHRLELLAPGGVRLLGREAADTIWTTWHEAFPDNRLAITTIHADDRGGVHEGRFTGTHTGTLRSPAGDIAPTNRTVDARFCAVYEFDEGKITSFHLYFDQMEMLTQLGLAPGTA